MDQKMSAREAKLWARDAPSEAREANMQNPKPLTAWAIIAPGNSMWAPSITSFVEVTRAEAIKRFSDGNKKFWRWCRKRGYRAARVIVEVIE